MQLDQQDTQDILVNLERKEAKATRDRQDGPDQQEQLVALAIPEALDLLDQVVPLEALDKPGLWEQQVRLDSRELQVSLDHQAARVQRALLECRVAQDKLVVQDSKERQELPE